MAKLIVGLILIVSIILWSSPGQADAPCIPPRGEVQIWVLPIPIVLSYWIRPEVPRPEIVEEALAVWNSPIIRFSRIREEPTSFLPGGPVHAVIGLDENIPSGRAVTYPGWPSAILLRPSAIYPTNEIDYGSLLVHEAGHVLGLGHSNCQQSAMSPTYSSVAWRTLPMIDVQARDLMYPWPHRVFLPYLH